MNNALEWELNSTVSVCRIRIYDPSNKEEHDIGTANAPLTDDLIIRLWVSDTGLSRSVIYRGSYTRGHFI